MRRCYEIVQQIIETYNFFWIGSDFSTPSPRITFKGVLSDGDFLDFFKFEIHSITLERFLSLKFLFIISKNWEVFIAKNIQKKMIAEKVELPYYIVFLSFKNLVKIVNKRWLENYDFSLQ